MSIDKETFEYGVRVFETIGFPAVVACWLMSRTDKKLDRFADSLDALKEEIHKT